MQNMLSKMLATQPTKPLYHFTDTRNLASIRQHGLLPLRDLLAKGIVIPAAGGDHQSHISDRQLDLDGHVHLSIMNQHPMAKAAQDDGRIATVFYIQIEPEVLHRPGVLFCPIVSTTKGATIRPIVEIDDHIDFGVAFKSYVDFQRDDNLSRVQAMRKLEVLVPGGIAPELLRNL